MAITHVASLGAETVNNPETAYLPASVGTQIVIPPSVAVGDVLLMTGAVQAESRVGDPLAADGWTPLVTPTYADYPGTAYKAGTSQSGSRTHTPALTGMWWRRWTATSRTSFRGGGSHTSTNQFPPTTLTIWRGVQGFRDLALITAGTTVQWPGAAGAVGDVTVLAGVYSGALVGATVPVTTSRAVGGSAGTSVALLSAVPASTGTTPAYDAARACTDASLLTVSLCLPIAPLTPSLGSPAPSAITDLTVGPTFTWTHQRAGYAGSASGAQESYALRRRVGVAAYEYWNAGTAAWGPGITWNASNLGEVTFPNAKWAGETVYAWSVATTEDAGHNQGPFAPDRVLTARTKPLVSFTAPLAVVTTPQPALTWSTTFTTPWAPIAYEAKIFTQATTELPGFNPDTVTPVWTSGQYASTATTVTPWIPLDNGVGYTAFVRVQQTGPQWSDWTSVGFLVSLAAPATPRVNAIEGTDPDTSCPLISITVAARDNLLTAADASFEAGVGSWVAGANTTLATTTAWAVDGAKALQLTAVAAGDVYAEAGYGTQAVTSGEVVTGTAVFYAPTTARTCGLSLIWFDAGGSYLGVTPSPGVPNSTTSNTTITHTATAPAGAATVMIAVTAAALAAGETLYVDRPGIAPGAATPWSPGGYTNVTTTIEFSDDPLAGIWGILAAGATLGRTVTITDYCAQPGQLRVYRARTSAGIYSSPPSGVAIAGIDVEDFWIVDTAAGVGIRLVATEDAERTRSVDRGVFEALGRPARVVVTGTTRNQTGSMTARADTEADTDALADLLASGGVLLIQQPPEAGVYPRHLFTAVTSDVKVARLTHGAFPWRALSWSWTEDDAPVGEAPDAVLSSLGVGIWS